MYPHKEYKEDLIFNIEDHFLLCDTLGKGRDLRVETWLQKLPNLNEEDIFVSSSPFVEGTYRYMYKSVNLNISLISES